MLSYLPVSLPASGGRQAAGTSERLSTKHHSALGDPVYSSVAKRTRPLGGHSLGHAGRSELGATLQA